MWHSPLVLVCDLNFSSGNRMPLYWIGPQRIGYRIFLFHFFSSFLVEEKNGFTESIELMLKNRDMVCVSFVHLHGRLAGLILHVLSNSNGERIDSIPALFFLLSFFIKTLERAQWVCVDFGQKVIIDWIWRFYQSILFHVFFYLKNKLCACTDKSDNRPT